MGGAFQICPEADVGVASQICPAVKVDVAFPRNAHEGVAYGGDG